jgi:hypothetical protein
MQPSRDDPQSKIATSASAKKNTSEVILQDDYQRIEQQVSSIRNFPEIIKHDNALVDETFWVDAYKAKGLDFKKMLALAPTQSVAQKDEIARKFAESKDVSPFGKYLEKLPLMANKSGRLGAYVDASIKGTAKFDDAGNFYVDNVITLKNTYDYNLVDRALHPERVRKQITFLVDATTNPASDGLGKKKEKLEQYCLKPGVKANVLGYVNDFGVPGLKAPKVVVYISEEKLNAFSKKIKIATHVTQSGGLMIANDRIFDDLFRDFFGDYLEASSENALTNIDYLTILIQKLQSDPSERKKVSDLKELRDSYQQISDFIRVYKVTPIEKTPTSANA